MFRVSSRPMKSHEAPPSRLRNRPRPLVWLFRGLPSPVPTHTRSGLSGLRATAPMLWVGWSSKMDSHVTPALVLFQSPPEAVPT